ncbi:SagB-type dehydrogenase domain-containing protein [Jatrophihabitans endophyticus]|uniref:SagB-type dehydrogenase domain-containing protein n=1 Tax=Jatrophihabitans endophyticus TaxID=1206085 RepID=A0A1M5GL95_9ACTN|nr:SagB/ThcOx family dehydrogenase [Jatrophihabitans endophyticus]SHG04487.1 SagB-type dehydrogenase domain-containing protein [Jatrophihabitans endophyticus]
MSGDGAPEVGDHPPAFEASRRAYGYSPRGPLVADGQPPLDFAEEFHEASKMHADFPATALGPGGQQLTTSATARLRLGRKALAFTGTRLALPAPAALPAELLTLARHRRSGLPEDCGDVDLADLSAVLAVAAGPVPGRPDVRVTPSAGAMYPLDVVVVAHAVRGLPPGAYVYDAVGHSLLPRLHLDPVRFHADVGATIAPPRPAVMLALVATFARSRAKYGLRGYRFALLEAGHVAQAALTAATSLGLATLPWGGFIDSAADRHLELDGLERSCVYLVGLSAAGGRA